MFDAEGNIVEPDSEERGSNCVSTLMPPETDDTGTSPEWPIRMHLMAALRVLRLLHEDVYLVCDYRLEMDYGHMIRDPERRQLRNTVLCARNLPGSQALSGPAFFVAGTNAL